MTLFSIYPWYRSDPDINKKYHVYTKYIPCICHVYSRISRYTWDIHGIYQYLLAIHCIHNTYTKIPGGSSCASGQGPIPPDPPAMTSPGCVIIALHNIQVRDMPSCCVSTNTMYARAQRRRAHPCARGLQGWRLLSRCHHNTYHSTWCYSTCVKLLDWLLTCSLVSCCPMSKSTKLPRNQ